MIATEITPEVIGSFVDSIAGKGRTRASVAGRTLEEMVELALAAGLTSGQIMSHVADALHNQSLKASQCAEKTIFPSQLVGDESEFGEECADVSILLKDLCWVAGIDLGREEVIKHEKFVRKQFRVAEGGVLYAIKPHVIS